MGFTGTAAAGAGTAAAAGAGTAAAASGLTLAQMAAIASLAATTLGIGTSIYDRANRPGAQGVPKPPSYPTTNALTTPTGAVLPPGEKSNVRPLAQGTAPGQFFANLTEDPAAGNLDVLSSIRSGLA